MKIKVCGMREKENIIKLDHLRNDFMGLIFYDKSPRFVGDAKIPKTQAKKIGVFVNASIEYIISCVEKYDLYGIQLHGDESASFIETFKTQLGNKSCFIIKAFRMTEELSSETLIEYQDLVDLFILDSGGKNYGGNGIIWDYELLEKLEVKKEFLLSGGINDTIPLEELTKIHPLCVGIDINSGFETKPGFKDIEKIKAFIKGKTMEKYSVDQYGYYGKFGGAYIPEMLHPHIEELQKNYHTIIKEEAFQKEFRALLKDYVGRPSPLYYAERLSKKFGTNIYFKREDLNHTGAHKVNNTIGQILLAKRLGKTRIIAETGAGQHGVATATVCALMGLECIVYMGAKDVERQAPNVNRMKMLGAKVEAVHSGSKTLKDATNEAIRDWINHPETYYLIGSVVGPHPYPDMVAQFQSVISEEIKWQLKEKTGSEYPSAVIACVGGGSNAAGAFYHFIDHKETRLIAVEAAGEGVDSGKTAATTALGTIGVLHGSKSLMMQTADGQVVEPHSISAGLDYPGIGPLHAHLFDTKRAKFYAVTDTEAINSAYELTQLEGIIPALETAHATAILHKLSFSPTDNIVINLSGRGDKDLATFINYKK